ncbi:MAG TPA: phosphotransferase [Chitinophagaceae bacterium]|nr:phosphotransferase [Chitinophagaceae bacterium]
MIERVLKAYGLQGAKLEYFGNGLINQTWAAVAPQGHFILQKVNDDVFKRPLDIASNTRLIADHLKQYQPGYFFVAPILSADGNDMIFFEGEGYFRAFPFVENSHSTDIVKTPEQAYEAASQFGKFTHLLSGFNADELTITIPDFHNLELRYNQFLDALKEGNPERLSHSKKQVEQLMHHVDIVDEYISILSQTAFKRRVTHHDTKISNVLFDKNEKAICIIDLDTVMPGYFFSDVGDMMRTYLSPASEEEKEYDKIVVRDDFYKAIVQGYSAQMKNELTAIESKYFFYAARFMIYMQALRFLTDYLNDDVYYGAKYKDHNFVRATNQLVLLQRLIEKKRELGVLS